VSPVRKPGRSSPHPFPEIKTDRLETLVCPIHVVTPIFGGGTEPGKSDDLDPIRVPTIRGHLRFWWRATMGSAFATVDEMRQAEFEIWGGTQWEDFTATGDPSKPSRKSRPSAVEVTVQDVAPGDPEDPPPLSDVRSYALFPARTVQGCKLRMGVSFSIHLRFPQDDKVSGIAIEDHVRRALRAWVVFGGYGARSRRGAGALSFERVPDGEDGFWIPQDPSALSAWFKGSGSLGPFPRLKGSLFLIASASRAASSDPKAAWIEALGWLAEFRQAAARPGGGKRGVTLWPEPDKMRKLRTPIAPHTAWQHPPSPKLTNAPAWPRASFGLPIVTRFQDKDATDSPYPNPEPGFTPARDRDGNLVWKRRDLTLKWRQDEKCFERLASPLIVRPFGFADGTWRPGLLWLNRAFPEGDVVLFDGGTPVAGSEASFDMVAAPGDKVRFAPLATAEVGAATPGSKVRTAFFEWVKKKLGPSGFVEIKL